MPVTTTNSATSKWQGYSQAAKVAKKIASPRVAAFGAAAAGGLMACSDVEAEIIYSGPLNIVVNAGSVTNFDFNGDLDDDLNISVQGGSFDADGLNGGGVFANPGTSSYAQKFDFGDMITGATNTGNGWMGWYNGGIYSDPWGALQAGINNTGPVTGFLGFTFNGNNGWMELSLAADSIGQPVSATVLGWAYDDTGAPIMAGDIGAIPEPGSAGLLALGALAAGALGLRRKREEETV